jgi:type IV pilus assembly protein PilP
MEQLKNKLDEIEQRPRGRIEPPPEFKPIATFSYSAHRLRSPFTPSREEEEEEQGRDTPEGQQVEPDFARSKQYLEQFSLETLQMVGTITRPNQPLEALVKDPGGTVNRVVEGDYMGKNYGKVTEVTGAKIEIREIVPDGEDGWVERPRTIRLEE